jgi:hypothetical protein
MSTKYFAFALFAGAFAAAMILAGCGNSPPTSAILPVTSGTTTALPMAGVIGRLCFQGLAPCVPPAQFESTCEYYAGGYITTKYGPSVCIVTRTYNYWDYQYSALSFGYSNRLPIITPSIPNGGIDTGIFVRKGARLNYRSADTGYWGYSQLPKTGTWGPFSWSWFTNNCKSVDWDGNSGSNGQITNEGQPAGLFGSDGTESFFLGIESRTLTIHHDGTLRLGVNANANTPNGCTTAGYPVIEQTTCEDASGNSYSCS